MGDEKRRWEVTVRVDGTVTVKVEAETADKACERACERVRDMSVWELDTGDPEVEDWGQIDGPPVPGSKLPEPAHHTIILDVPARTEVIIKQTHHGERLLRPVVGMPDGAWWTNGDMAALLAEPPADASISSAPPANGSNVLRYLDAARRPLVAEETLIKTAQWRDATRLVGDGVHAHINPLYLPLVASEGVKPMMPDGDKDPGLRPVLGVDDTGRVVSMVMQMRV